ncbi:hypothetical protein Salat_2436900 [Sesamum alatum]|uniref:Reverse transcriptase zinc-binding domain-containing protein n=1 Tax=Sesamum alatum TaxID=300844 RepID=A0AAE1XYZ9_9LAMI|nr:hypothetical protein Salat_2436900 [Sesamum alatum]
MWDDVLQMRMNLKRQGVVEDTCCPCSALEPEDASYVLFSCTFVRLVWALSGLPVSSIPQHEGDGLEWLRTAHCGQDSQDFAYFLTVSWGLWLRCNQLVSEGNQLHAPELVAMARRTLNHQLGVFPIDPG